MSIERRTTRLRESPLKPLFVAMAVAQLLGVGACALPRSAPSDHEFNKSAAAGSIQLVAPTKQDAAATLDPPLAGFPAAWRASATTLADAIGPGDVLSVTVFERDTLNVFAAVDGSSTITGLEVGQDGGIQLPYVGLVQVGGLTPIEARTPILRSIRHLAIATDVVVTVTSRNSQLVSVQGDVSKPGVVTLAPETNRLLGLLASAGPNQADLEMATVTVRRGGESGVVRLADLYQQPETNIALRNNDDVIVVAAPKYVRVLGTAGLQQRVRILRPSYSLLDAVGDAHGLNDATASPESVYLLRYVDLASTPTAIPRVYHFDFRDPSQMALAASFVVHDGDSVVISDAPFTQATKVISAFSLVLSAGHSADQIVNP